MNALLIGLLAVAVVLAVIRLLRGPTDADRVVAFDLLSACGIAACALAAAITAGIGLFPQTLLDFAGQAAAGLVEVAR